MTGDCLDTERGPDMSTASTEARTNATATLAYPCRDPSPGILAGQLDSTTRMLVFYTVALIIANVLLNGLTFLTVLYLNKRRLRPNHILLLGLSTLGWALALFYLPFVLVLLLWGSGTDCRLLCRALTALERGLIAAMTWGLAILAIDRYMFIVRHSTYQSSMSVRRSALAVAGVWCIGLAFGTTSLLVSAHTTTASGTCLCHLTLDFYGIYHLLYSASYITFAFILPTILLLVFYGFIIRVAAKRVSINREKNPFRLTPSHRQGFPCNSSALPRGGHPKKLVNPHQRASTLHLYEIKTIRVICLAILCYLTCVTPYFVINVVVSTGHWSLPAFPQNIYLTSILILHTNSSCSPLLYGFTNRRLRAVLFGFIRAKLGSTSRYSEKSKHTASAHISVMPGECLVGRQDSQESEPSSFSTNSRETIVNCDVLDSANRYAIDPEEDKAFHSQTTELCSKESYSITPCGACSQEELSYSPSSQKDKRAYRSSSAGKRGRPGRHGSDPIRNPLVRKTKKASFGLSSLAETETLLTITEEEGLQNGHISNTEPEITRATYDGDSLYPEKMCNGEVILLESTQSKESLWKEISDRTHSERLLRPRSPSNSWELH